MLDIKTKIKEEQDGFICTVTCRHSDPNEAKHLAEECKGYLKHFTGCFDRDESAGLAAPFSTNDALYTTSFYIKVRWGNLKELQRDLKDLTKQFARCYQFTDTQNETRQILLKFRGIGHGNRIYARSGGQAFFIDCANSPTESDGQWYVEIKENDFTISTKGLIQFQTAEEAKQLCFGIYIGKVSLLSLLRRLDLIRKDEEWVNMYLFLADLRHQGITGRQFLFMCHQFINLPKKYQKRLYNDC